MKKTWMTLAAAAFLCTTLSLTSCGDTNTGTNSGNTTSVAPEEDRRTGIDGSGYVIPEESIDQDTIDLAPGTGDETGGTATSGTTTGTTRTTAGTTTSGGTGTSSGTTVGTTTTGGTGGAGGTTTGGTTAGGGTTGGTTSGNTTRGNTTN